MLFINDRRKCQLLNECGTIISTLFPQHILPLHTMGICGEKIHLHYTYSKDLCQQILEFISYGQSARFVNVGKWGALMGVGVWVGGVETPSNNTSNVK